MMLPLIQRKSDAPFAGALVDRRAKSLQLRTGSRPSRKVLTRDWLAGLAAAAAALLAFPSQMSAAERDAIGALFP